MRQQHREIMERAQEEQARFIAELRATGLMGDATDREIWQAAIRIAPCPKCGRTDGGHTPTREERRELRRAKVRAFCEGFLSVFAPFRGRS